MKVRKIALLCALIMISQMIPADCEKQKDRKRDRAGSRRAGGPEPGSDNQNGKGQKTRGQKTSLKGKFISKEKSECTWALSEAETATLKIDCKKGESSFSCEFTGNPSTCPQYAGNQKTFWKQITKSLKKQKNICEDPQGMLKSKICKKGPSSAHLKLVPTRDSEQEKPGHHGRQATVDTVTSVATEQQTGLASSDCVEDVDYVDQKKVAEEYCSEHWVSFCNFLMSMIQDKRCK
ncbi:fibroblast growth factor-binding protein 1 [Tiliqua scincoides]|uniref:fibroblast growth factor-binding protein 1 n=1 Tax=Tiliqua scincoides TaxID=71010 RepID=UPI003461EB92